MLASLRRLADGSSRTVAGVSSVAGHCREMLVRPGFNADGAFRLSRLTSGSLQSPTPGPGCYRDLVGARGGGQAVLAKILRLTAAGIGVLLGRAARPDRAPGSRAEYDFGPATRTKSSIVRARFPTRSLNHDGRSRDGMEVKASADGPRGVMPDDRRSGVRGQLGDRRRRHTWLRMGRRCVGVLVEARSWLRDAVVVAGGVNLDAGESL